MFSAIRLPHYDILSRRTISSLTHILQLFIGKCMRNGVYTEQSFYHILRYTIHFDGIDFSFLVQCMPLNTRE